MSVLLDPVSATPDGGDAFSDLLDYDNENSSDYNGFPCDFPTNYSNSTNGTGDYGGCEPFYETYPNPFAVVEIKAIFIALYGLVFLMCFVGNLLVLLVVLKHRKMRTITNFFLANLALADLCVGIFCVIPNLSQQIYPEWILGKVVCKLQYFVQSLSYTASVNILTIISVERFFAIIYPLRSKQLATMCLLRLAVILVWIIAAGAGLPQLILYDTVKIPHTDITFCMVNADLNKEAYAMCNFLFGYVFPLCLMIVMYSCISTVLWRSSQKNDAVKAGGYSCSQGSASVRSSTGKSTKRSTNGTDTKAKSMHENFEMREKRQMSSNDSGSGGDEQQTLVDSANRRSIATRLLKRMDSTLSEDNDTNEDETETEIDYEDDWPGKDGTGRSFIADIRSSLKYQRKTHSNGVKAKEGNKKEFLPRPTPVKAPVHVYPKRMPSKGRCKPENALRARRRVIRLLLAVIISFASCVLPYHIRTIWQSWSSPDPTFWNVLMSPITFVVYYLNSGLNPVLYAFLSDRFRQCFVEVVLCKEYRVKRQYSVSNKTVHSVA